MMRGSTPQRVITHLDTLPPPVVGWEVEYTGLPLPNQLEGSQLLKEGIKAQGHPLVEYDSVGKGGYMLPSGAHLHLEAGTQPTVRDGKLYGYRRGGASYLLEMSTAAATSIKWAVAAAHAGIQTLGAIARSGSQAIGRRPFTVYRRGGYAHSEQHNQSMGAHQSHNYWLPLAKRDRIDRGRQRDALSSLLATLHLITGAGMVGDEFLLSQHAPHITHITGQSDAGKKPMFTLHTNPDRSYTAEGQGRLEVKVLDEPLSRFASFVGAGVLSAFVRVQRFGDRGRARTMPAFRDSVKVLQSSNTIESIHKRHSVKSWNPLAKKLSIVEMLEAQLTHLTNNPIYELLTEEEHEAMGLAFDLLPALKQVRALGDAAIAGLADRLEWAARATELHQRYKDHEHGVTRLNHKAVARDLRRDAIEPPDEGVLYWRNQKSQEVVPASMVRHCLTAPPPGSRTEQLLQHVQQLQERQARNIQVRWDLITYRDTYNSQHYILFADPTGQKAPAPFSRAQMYPPFEMPTRYPF